LGSRRKKKEKAKVSRGEKVRIGLRGPCSGLEKHSEMLSETGIRDKERKGRKERKKRAPRTNTFMLMGS